MGILPSLAASAPEYIMKSFCPQRRMDSFNSVTTYKLYEWYCQQFNLISFLDADDGGAAERRVLSL